jgi:hypothetical protein
MGGLKKDVSMLKPIEPQENNLQEAPMSALELDQRLIRVLVETLDLYFKGEAA